MTDFEKTYQNYNPRQAALDEARALLTAAAKAAMADGTLPEAELPAFIVEIPADVKNGDIASNLAMAGARTWRKAPRMIAEALLAHLPDLTDSVFAKVEIAGPGFINLFLSPAYWAGVDTLILGCTHYPLLKTMIGEFMGQSVTLVDPAKTAAHHLEQMLSERGLRAAQEHEGQAHFYVSDVPDSFVQTADLFLGEYKGGPVDQIAIDKY